MFKSIENSNNKTEIHISEETKHSNFLFHPEQCYGSDILIFQNIIQFPVIGTKRILERRKMET